MSLIVIVARDVKTGLIGADGQLPWRLPRDLSFFRNITVNRTIVMGRATYESLPVRPLQHRTNVVLSSTMTADESISNLFVYKTAEELIGVIKSKQAEQEDVCVIGGESVYRLVFAQMRVDAVIVTQVNWLDALVVKEQQRVFDNAWLDPFRSVAVTGTYIQERITYNYVLYMQKDQIEDEHVVCRFKNAIKCSHGQYKENEEYQYIELIKQIDEQGDKRMTRGVDSEGNRLYTKSVFGAQMRFDLSEGLLPVCTLRKCWPRGSVQELLWILRGSTDVQELADLGVHVWDGNTSRQALDSYGFTDRPEYDLGPTYGFNLRHFGIGEQYTDKNADYTDKGKDQLQELINGIKRDPFSRRHLLTLWDPASVGKASLPPCSVMFQFSVSSQQRLSLHVFLRSSDTLLALYSWNIPQYAVLCAIVAHSCGLGLGQLVVSISDAHIYSNQEAGLQMTDRVPLPQPLLSIKKELPAEPWQYKLTDIAIDGYTSHGAISMQMAI